MYEMIGMIKMYDFFMGIYEIIEKVLKSHEAVGDVMEMIKCLKM